jgi:hypothetical protein
VDPIAELGERLMAMLVKLIDALRKLLGFVPNWDGGSKGDVWE